MPIGRYLSPKESAVLRRAVVELSRPNPLLIDLPYVEEAMPLKTVATIGRKEKKR